MIEGLAVGVGFGAIGKSASATLESARYMIVKPHHSGHLGTTLSVLNTEVSSFQEVGIERLHCKSVLISEGWDRVRAPLPHHTHTTPTLVLCFVCLLCIGI